MNSESSSAPISESQIATAVQLGAEPVTELSQPQPQGNPNLQVRFKSEGGRLLLLLPPDPEHSRNPVPWSDLWQQLKQRISAGDRFWQPQTPVHLVGRDRLLDVRQLQTIAEILTEADLQLRRIYTSRRQTALAAATAGYSVEQQSTLAHLSQTPSEPGKALEEPLYLQATVRSGTEIRHPGTVVVLGDVNPGGSIVAEGDILVWGRLRGVAHAGAGGNSQCRIMALHLEPTQIRIADKVARSPEKPPARYQPEVAYIGSEGIRIAIATEFAKAHLSATSS